MIPESRKTLRARIQAVLQDAAEPAAAASNGNANANICEPGRDNGFSTVSATTIRNVDNPVSASAQNTGPMEGIYRVHFEGFDRAAYQAMEDTLLSASAAVSKRFVPTDPVSMALGARPDVVVINLNHPDASQFGKTLRPEPGVPVVWVSIAPEQQGVGEPGTPLYTSLLKAMQDVLAQRG